MRAYSRMFVFSPFSLIFPLIFFFVAARVVMGLLRGVTRRRFREFPEDLRLPPQILQQTRTRLPLRGPSSEAQIFKLAYRLKGRLTLSDVVVETGLSLNEAEEIVEGMVDSVHVRMEVDDRGTVLFEFPEIIRRFEDDL